MGKLFKHIALFSLPLVGLLVWMLASNPPIAYRYKMIQKDCRTGSWIFRRLHVSPAPIDVAFVGTSRTMCDVNDSLVEAKLALQYGKHAHLANLGVCRIGENLHYLITKDLLAQKHPKYLLYELGPDLHTNSHFHFPYLATSSEAIDAAIFPNGDFLGDLLALGWNRLVYHRERALGIEREFEDFLEDSLHSFMVVPQDGIADSAGMARIKAKRQVNLTEALPTGGIGLLKQWESQYPKHYLTEVAALCKANGTELIFLYLPPYGAAAKRPQEWEFLAALGETWIPPDSIFHDYRLHFDDSHLNMRGASKLSDWLSEKLATLPKL